LRQRLRVFAVLPPARQETKVARLTYELNEVRQQQTATRRSTLDLRVVVDTLCRNGASAVPRGRRKHIAGRRIRPNFREFSTRETALPTLINRM